MRDKLRQLSETLEANESVLINEEAIKQVIVLKFLTILGYDTYNPSIVQPEYNIIHLKDRVDYGIVVNDKLNFIIEVKSLNKDLDKYVSQTKRYFNCCDTRLAILTNGREFRFYSDNDNINIMDAKPFHITHLNSITDNDLLLLSELKYGDFDLSSIRELGRGQEYIKQIKQILEQETTKPSKELITFFRDKIDRSLYLSKQIKTELRFSVRYVLRELINGGEIEEVKEFREIKDDNSFNFLEYIKTILAKHNIHGLDLTRITGKQKIAYYSVMYNNRQICRLRHKGKEDIGLMQIGYGDKNHKELKWSDTIIQQSINTPDDIRLLEVNLIEYVKNII